jgi:hypothetical protein
LFETYRRQYKDHFEAKKHLNVTDVKSLAECIKQAKEQYQSSDKNISDVIELLGIFNNIDIERLQDINNTLKAVAVDFAQFNKENGYDYWDRLAIILLAVDKCLKPILKSIDKNNHLPQNTEEILHNIKCDFMLSYVTRVFKRDFTDTTVSGDDFVKNVEEVLTPKVETFNTKYASESNPGVKLSTEEEKLTDEYKKSLESFKESVTLARNYEGHKVFIDKMWEEFVKEFIDRAPKCDEAYILGQALNIAYYTADYLDHIKNERSRQFCFNYNYLYNDFNAEKSNCKEFEHNHYEKSTDYSNFMYELAEKHKLKNLRILIEYYLIQR